MSVLYKEAWQQRELLISGDISAVELMQETLAHIDRINPKLNAIVGMHEHDACLDLAAKVDPKRDGPLAGLPVAIKDLANATGLKTTQGSPLFSDYIAENDDIMVARMRSAGAVIFGKTNTPEFGLGSNTFNSVYGVTRNPYDVAKTCGGSSGGAGVALAARMVSIADGSDMMGSLRNPAAWTNTYGMRPTWGMIPSDPDDDVFMHQLSTLGPMARSPKDLAILLSVQAGASRYSTFNHKKTDFIHASNSPAIANMRIAWLGDWGGAIPFEHGILEICNNAIKQLSTLGCKISDVCAPLEFEILWNSWRDLRAWEVSNELREFYDDSNKVTQLKPEAIWEIETGNALSGSDVYWASMQRMKWFRKAVELFEKYDFLALPTAQVWPFESEEIYPKIIDGKSMDTYHQWMQVTIAASLLGLPVINIPIGFSEKGLPAGLQIIGPRGFDEKLISFAAAWEQEMQYAHILPPMLS